MNKKQTGIFRGWSAVALALCMLGFAAPLPAQSRIPYNGRQLFLSGSNVAWINFAADLGPGTVNFTAFRTMFDAVQTNHGNAMRLWLHTNGANSPAFDANGLVSGPGTNAVVDLKAILDLAWADKVGLDLCLWSFDMLNTYYGTTVTDRAMRMLTDTAALNSYINNALIPMVTAVKGHPGIISWEVFNEPEGMSDEYGWDAILHVPMADIQRFINRVAGAIHRIDPAARVTNGAWAFISLTDIAPLAKKASAQEILQALSPAQKLQMEQEFASHYNFAASAEEIVARFAATINLNFYRDDRLIGAGGDPLGTLDFYTVHYYAWGGTSISPFHHPASHWQLAKPVVVAEFYLEDSLGITGQQMYNNLYSNGYAGALTWQWYWSSQQQSMTMSVMNNLFASNPDDLDVTQASGKVYAFAAAPAAIGYGDSTALSWTASAGSVVSLNGTTVSVRGTQKVSPPSTTTYTLIAAGAVAETSKVSIRVTATGVAASSGILPGEYRLNDCYPNPFNPSTTISYVFGTNSLISLRVYDLLGREVEALVNENQAAGFHRVEWNGSAHPSGVYFARLIAQPKDGSRQIVKMKRMVLLK